MTRKISRRTFITSGAAVAASAVLAGCQAPRRWVVREPYVRAPEEQLTGVPTWYASTCRQCPAGCGIIVKIMNGRAIKIEGNPEHPLNRGKLCAQGQAGLQLLYNPDRLAAPVQASQRGSGQQQKLSWDQALSALSSRLQGAGGNVAVWAGTATSSHLYDLLQRFTQATGAPAPVVYDLYGALTGYPVLSAANQALFGKGDLPVYDLGHADIVLSFGADFLITGLSPTRYGIEYGRFRSQGLGMRGYLVQFEPRMSNTAAKADEWVLIRPGSEGLVAQALARLIADQAFGSTERQARARAIGGNVDIAAASQASDVSMEDLTRLARVFAEAQHPVAIPGNALLGYDNGPAVATAVQALNIIAGPAGGLALATAAAAPARPPVSSFAEVTGLIGRMAAGQVQALLVFGANPVYDLPEKAGFTAALAKVPFVASFSPMMDETAAQADLVLPDRTYLESWGYDVVAPHFGLPVVGSQQPVVPPVFDARAAADVLLSVAKGIPAAAQALAWPDEVAYLKETITKLPAGAFGGSDPDTLWARFLQHGGWWSATAPAQEAPQAASPSAVTLGPASFQGDEGQYPYYLYLYAPTLLGTGGGANLPWLQGSPDPMTSISWQSWVEIHPDTMARLGLQKGDVVRVTTPQGEVEAPAYPYPAIRPDTVAMPLGQGHSAYGRYAEKRGVNPLRLVGAGANSAGTNLAWSALRAQVTRTGQQVRMATFEWTPGVTEGFPNKGFPGE